MFANSKSDYSRLPAGVKEVRSQGGNTIPMVFVTTADGSKGLDAVSYDVLKSDMRDAVRDLGKSLETVNVLGGESSGSASDEPASAESLSTGPLAPRQDWQNSDGKTIKAGIIKVKGENVVFSMPDGKELAYPLSKLSEESQNRIAALVAGS